MSNVRKPVKVRTIDINDGSIEEFSSLAACGKLYNTGASLIMYWIKNGITRHGKRFEIIGTEEDYNDNYNSEAYGVRSRKCIVEDADGNLVGEFESIADMSRAYGVGASTIRYRMRMGIPFKGLVFKLFDEDGEIQTPKSCMQKESYKKDDILDREKYRILNYVTKNRVCITPCPFYEAPKPRIGSAKCMSCPSFRGRSISTNEVACNRKLL